MSLLGMTAGYAALGAWAWFAWYDEQPRLTQWKIGGDGWFGRDTYAGGADKLGHAWTGYVLTRLGAGLLRSNGWNPSAAILLSAGLGSLALLWVEVNDGYYTEFSIGDLTHNTLGALLGIAADTWPALDAAFDFRLQWFPSLAYRRNPSPNVAEDYSGQTHILAFKPAALTVIRTAPPYLSWIRFINPVIAFQARHYKPKSTSGATPEQQLFVGITLDVQAILDAALEKQTSGVAVVSRRVAHTVSEYLNLPFSTLKVAGIARRSSKR